MRYRTIVADPPWEYDNLATGRPGWRKGGAHFTAFTMPYPTMPVDEIAALPVGDFAEKDAHLYLWTTQRYLRDSYRIAEVWGFRPSLVLVWCKSPKGFVGTFVCATEFILFCKRGSLAAKEKHGRNWWHWKRGVHSQKPEAFFDIVEQVSPGPYLEMFARRQRLGWDTWGDEALQHVEIA